MPDANYKLIRDITHSNDIINKKISTGKVVTFQESLLLVNTSF